MNGKIEQPIKKSKFSVEELLASMVTKMTPDDGKQIYDIRRVLDGEEVVIHVINRIPDNRMGRAERTYAEYAGNSPECFTMDAYNDFGQWGTFKLKSPCVVLERSPTVIDNMVVCVSSDEEINIASKIITLRREAKEILEKLPLEAIKKIVSQLKQTVFRMDGWNE